MRMLIVGSGEECSLERWYAGHLEELGVTIKFFPAQSIFYDYYRRSILNKLVFKAGVSGIYRRIDMLIRQAVEEFRPEFIWIFKGMEIDPSFLQWARAKGIRLMNFNADNPFIFSGSGSGNDNITRSLGLYDLHLTYDRDIRDRISRDYGIPCMLLPFGFELTDPLYEECRREEETNAVCFLGNPDKYRAPFINELALSVPVHVFGHDWKDYIQDQRAVVFGPAYGDDFWKVLRRYRVQLNLMRPHNTGSHNMRSFEIPSVGAIGLFPDTVDHRTYFKEKEELFLFRDMGECIQLAKQVLEMSSEEASGIRDRARQRSILSGYSYRERARDVLNYLNTLNL